MRIAGKRACLVLATVLAASVSFALLQVPEVLRGGLTLWLLGIGTVCICAVLALREVRAYREMQIRSGVRYRARPRRLCANIAQAGRLQVVTTAPNTASRRIVR